MQTSFFTKFSGNISSVTNVKITSDDSCILKTTNKTTREPRWTPLQIRAEFSGVFFPEFSIQFFSILKSFPRATHHQDTRLLHLHFSHRCWPYNFASGENPIYRSSNWISRLTPAADGPTGNRLRIILGGTCPYCSFPLFSFRLEKFKLNDNTRADVFLRLGSSGFVIFVRSTSRNWRKNFSNT